MSHQKKLKLSPIQTHKSYLSIHFSLDKSNTYMFFIFATKTLFFKKLYIFNIFELF